MVYVSNSFIAVGIRESMTKENIHLPHPLKPLSRAFLLSFSLAMKTQCPLSLRSHCSVVVMISISCIEATLPHCFGFVQH